MKVKNIPFVEYFDLPIKDEYNYYLRYGKIEAKDVFAIGEFVDAPFGFVKDMQELLNYEGLTWANYFEIMSKKTGQTVEQIGQIGLFTLQQGRIYCREQIEFINKLESQNLSSPASVQEEQAGLDEFKMFRSFPQFDKIIKEWGMTWEQVEAMPYSRAFAKLKYDKVLADYISNLQKIKTR
jgi:hypothetical protein